MGCTLRETIAQMCVEPNRCRIEKCGYLNITRLGGSYLTPAQEEIEFDQRVPIMLTPAVVVRFFFYPNARIGETHRIGPE